MGSRLEKRSNEVSKAIENHDFDHEDGDEYSPSTFGGFTDYFRRKKIKLQNLDADTRSRSANNPPVFKGIVVHVNGYTQPSLNDLHKLVVSHHGGFLQYLDGKTMVTHIVASNLTPKKAEEFKRYRVVKPAWIVDSVAAGKLQPWTNYKVVSEGPNQQTLALSSGGLSHKKPSNDRSYRDQSTPQVVPLETEADPSKSACSTPSRSIRGEDSGATPNSPEPDADGSPSPRLQARPTTAEEHNTALLADPNVRRNTVLDPDFIENYYKGSRLHHLSTWKASLKSDMQNLITNMSASQKLRLKSVSNSRRFILHLDFDCFFAAVSLKRYPELCNAPVAVGHGGRNSELASCNYVARSFGLKNGMWLKSAREMCPDLKVIPYDFPAYEEASRRFYNQIIATRGVVESVSVDEALVDVSSIILGNSDGHDSLSPNSVSEQSTSAEARVDALAMKLRQDIKATTGCDVSVGIGGNILLAKLALRKAKPAGQFHVLPCLVPEFLSPLSVQTLPGIAKHIGSKLEQIGVKTIQDAVGKSKEYLSSVLGPKTGAKIWEFARGIDDKEVGDVQARKSVSAEVNWGVRFENPDQVSEFLRSLCDELKKRLLKENVKGKHLTLKVLKRAAEAPLETTKHLGHGSCDMVSKSVELGFPTLQPDVLTREVLSMLKAMHISPGDLRGLGVQMTKLTPIKDVNNPQSGQKNLAFAPVDMSPLKLAEEKVQLPTDDANQMPLFKSNRQFDDDVDPIEDHVTPKKSRAESGHLRFGAVELNESTPTKKLLNTMGTQFILPTQVDSQVLAQLPSNVRSKLVRSHSTKLEQTESARVSTVDSDAPHSLSSTLEQEILAFYNGDELAANSKIKELLATSGSAAQGPSETAPRVLPKPKSNPTGKRRGRPPKNSTVNKALPSRSNCITSHFRRTAPVATTVESPDEMTRPSTKSGIMSHVNQEYLAALPEDLQREVLAAQGLRPIKEQTRPRVHVDESLGKPPGPTFALKPRRPVPTFTAAKLSELSDIRQALADWVREFEEEGPYPEDVQALVVYLEKVIGDEGNMDKASRCVQWFEWILGENMDTRGNKDWIDAKNTLYHAVQNCVVNQRKLGRLKC